MTECGLRCELHANQCDFFVVTLSHCHLGQYSHWNQGSVQDNTERITYHKTCKYRLDRPQTSNLAQVFGHLSASQDQNPCSGLPFSIAISKIYEKLTYCFL